ncbi:MAG: hypothetical protein A2W31_00990 [Planctomycetes bacterium RBG_16_64_10]|nr:MAG: hypothetical protein A2W31_00990 [Planctomycetes bacterium RBG_16_64_10]
MAPDLVRLLSILLAGLATATWSRAAADGPYELSSTWRVGAAQHVECRLQVGGDLRLATDGQPRQIPMSVVAEIGYDEKLLELVPGRKGRLRSIRYFDQADAVIKVDKGGAKPTLRDHVRVVVVQSEAQQITMFSPHGPLTRDELDLIELPFDSLLLARLLPEHPVTVGQAWEHSADVMAALLGLDAASHCAVESVLGEVTDAMATVALAGTVHGAVQGVATELELKGTYQFDRDLGQITRLTVAFEERRSIGHVGPGLDVGAKIQLRITPIDRADRLDRETPSVTAAGNPDQLRLLYESRQSGFQVTHDRRWHLTADEARLAVLRLVDRGELIAQCQVAPVASKSPDRLIDLEAYQKDVRYALGDHFGQVVQATEWRDARGSQVLRVRVKGQVEALPIEWRYYLIAHESGRRVALAFTVEESLLAQFGDADLTLVRSIEFVPPAPDGRLETGSRPGDATR